jgi:hypothetical protein
MWLYGSGFPKSLDVSKAIDKVNGETGRLLKFTGWMRTTGVTARQINEATQTQMGSHYLTHLTQPAIPTPEIWATLRPLCADVPAWVDELVARIAAEREVIGIGTSAIANKSEGQRHTIGASKAVEFNITAPSTEAAKKWQGWGTALKPAVEPIVLARKPLIGTVAANVLTHGTGALNIDASRIGTEQTVTSRNGNSGGNGAYGKDERVFERVNPPGRWPANILLDEEAAAMLDEQSGDAGGGFGRRGKLNGGATKWGFDGVGQEVGYGDTGGASRFFYVAKASRSERNAGLEGMEQDFRERDNGFSSSISDTKNPRGNIHPTVKPVALMKYLIRLVVPKGGTVLDPFLGSGTTAVAAIEEGVEWIGCERELEYVEIIKARVAAAQPGMGLALEEER